MSYRFESNMREKIITQEFVNKLFLHPNITSSMYLGFEIEHLFGIPDIVFTELKNENNICICAIELKLSNWKRALTQAFRYRSFADFSYVVLDNSRIKPAINHLSEFKSKNIGLFGLDENGSVYKYYSPIIKPPYSPEMVKKILNMVNNCDGFQKLNVYIN